MDPKKLMPANQRLVMDIFLRYKDTLFWVFFTLLGISALMLYAQVLYADVVVVIMIIALGISKLGEEMVSKSLMRQQREIGSHLEHVSQWLESNYDFIRDMNERHEEKMYSLDSTAARSEVKLEKSYRQLAGKIIELENRLNRLAKQAPPVRAKGR